MEVTNCWLSSKPLKRQHPTNTAPSILATLWNFFFYFFFQIYFFLYPVYLFTLPIFRLLISIQQNFPTVKKAPLVTFMTVWWRSDNLLSPLTLWPILGPHDKILFTPQNNFLALAKQSFMFRAKASYKDILLIDTFIAKSDKYWYNSHQGWSSWSFSTFSKPRFDIVLWARWRSESNTLNWHLDNIKVMASAASELASFLASFRVASNLDLE